MKNLLLLLAFASWHCKSKKEIPAPWQTPPAAKLVGLQTFPCRGFCPVYVITIYENGLLEYNGERFVEKTGPASTMLTPEELARVRLEVTKADLWKYPDDVKSQVMDAPFTTLTAWKGDRTKSVRGSIDRPKPLLDLEKLIKNTAEAHGLKVIQGVNPNAAPATLSEVIVKLSPEENAGNWIVRFQEIKLRLVRRIADNTWLVGYDPAQMQEKQLIELLKSTGGVLEVQANQPVKDRN